jgi:putative FmdB family regulatory protein
MPLYEYQCADCGPFSAWGSMALAAGPADCPGCHRPAQRILSASQIASAGRSGRRRGWSEPRLVQHSADPPPAPKQPEHRHPHAPARPWMLGH